MSDKRKWNNEQLAEAVKASYSIRNVIILLGLIPAGGNYEQIKRYIKINQLDTSHFTGKGWNIGLKFAPNPPKPLKQLLTRNSHAQSYKLKKRLFLEGLKTARCELCGWHKVSVDGRIPVELDHINGDHYDNRLSNIRVLCPNCHSLQPTHRGKNKGSYKKVLDISST